MAKLEYDETGRLLFTQEMRKEYTILIPQMLPIHFGLFAKLLERTGYKVAILNNDGRSVVESGLKYVHNDACYPALLVIGQMIDAIQNQGYDPHKVALLITQTGGGCRASNYIHMLRKALDKAGLSFVPVLSLSFGLEKNPGFHWSIGLIRRLIYGMMYGDLIMNVANQVRPYEVHKGDTSAKVEQWLNQLLDRFDQGDGMTRKKMREILDEICADFKTIPVAGEPKIRVGVVGEIYIKFSALGNNQLEEFLLEEGAEPVVPGLTDFLIFKIYNRVSDVEMFGGSRAKQALCKFFMGYVEKCQLDMIEALTKAGFRAPGTFAQLHELIHGYLNDGCKMGEGWLLTAEMLELIHSGTPNIVCAQPFGCLPNHIVGRGTLKRFRELYPQAHILPLDYDASLSRVNQENRIKLLLTDAREKMAQADPAPVPAPAAPGLASSF